MRFRVLIPLFALFIALPAAARAQDFGVAESAETIDRGNFKFKINPMLVFGEDSADTGAFAGSIGYGVTSRFDLEGAVAFYDGGTFFGGNGEVWLVRHPAVDLSAMAGLHFLRGDDVAERTGVDLTLLASRHITPRVELYGALDMAFESVNDNGNFQTFHLVPGAEVRITQDLDFLVEVGIGLNDDARHYLSGGLAFYLR